MADGLRRRHGWWPLVASRQPQVVEADSNYIAASVTPQLLSYTRLIGPGETADAPFTAPAVPGD